jgi:hypothetical protein
VPHDTLHGLVADVTRLLTQGGGAATHDEKLRRRADALEQLAPAVPALVGLARALRRVLDASDGAAPLLDVLLLTQQLRVVLTQADIPGAVGDLSPRGPWRTNTPAGELYPLADTLRDPAGVMRVLEYLLGREEVGDLRLLDPILDCLADSHKELGRLLEQASFPSFGPKAFVLLLVRYHPRWLGEVCRVGQPRPLDPVRLLVSLLRPPSSEETWRNVVPVLSAIGVSVVPVLDEALEDADPAFRYRAAETLVLVALRSVARWPALRDAVGRVLELARGVSTWEPLRRQATALLKTWTNPAPVSW